MSAHPKRKYTSVISEAWDVHRSDMIVVELRTTAGAQWLKSARRGKGCVGAAQIEKCTALGAAGHRVSVGHKGIGFPPV